MARRTASTSLLASPPFASKASRIRASLALFAMGVAALPHHARAQSDYPRKPITLIVTFPAGGASDIVGRTVAEPLGAKLGHPVVVENRVGAGGSIGAAAVSRAAPDGHMLVLANSSPMSIAPWVLEKSPYDPVKGFTHVFYVGATPLIVIANPKTGPQTMADFVKVARGDAAGYPYGSGGPASIGHIVGEMFRSELKANMLHVAYKGGAPMSTDLMAGQINVAFDVSTAYIPLVKGGQLRALALTSTRRSELLPDVPTIVEAGFPKLVADNYFGISGPPGMPPAIVEKLHKALTEALAMPATKKKLEETGLVLQPMPVQEYGAYVEKQATDWQPAVKNSGAKL